MEDAQIKIKIDLDENKIPNQIFWSSTSSPNPIPLEAKAVLLGFWDSKEKVALRLDLWTKKMMVDEMADFVYQTLMGLSETYHKAVQDSALDEDIKKFAEDFQKKFKLEQLRK